MLAYNPLLLTEVVHPIRINSLSTDLKGDNFIDKNIHTERPVSSGCLIFVVAHMIVMLW